MDSVISWGILTVLCFIGFYRAFVRMEKEKAYYREQNNKFFREYNRTLNR